MAVLRALSAICFIKVTHPFVRAFQSLRRHTSHEACWESTRSQRHASAHSLAQGKICWCHSEHPAKRSSQVRIVGKPSAMSSRRDACPIHQIARCTLEPEPENVGSQRNAHRRSECVHEMRFGQT